MNVVENLSTKIPLTVHSGVTVQEGRTTEGRLRQGVPRNTRPDSGTQRA